MASDNALIIGCGYLGTRLAGILKDNDVAVAGTTRTAANWSHLKRLGVEVESFDLTSANATLPDLPWVDPVALDVFFMLPTSAVLAGLDSGGGFDRLLARLKALPLGRAFLISSTGVFARVNEQIVDADSTTLGEEPRSSRIALIEKRWLAMGEKFFVSRLAGLYGPGRIIGRDKLLREEPIPGDPDAWLNLIHVEDAARFIVASNRSTDTQRIEIASDTQPVKRRDYYGFVAQELSISRPPQFDMYAPTARRGSYRCDPTTSMRRTGWVPLHASFRDGIMHSIRAENNGS